MTMFVRAVLSTALVLGAHGSAAAGFLTMVSPNDQQRTTYLRAIVPHRFSASPVTVEWALSPAVEPPPLVRALVNGQPASDWTPPPYRFTLALPDGHFLLSVQADQWGHTAVEVPVVVSAANPLLGPAWLWTALNRYDYTFGTLSGPPIATVVGYPGVPLPVPGAPLRLPEDLQPWNEVLPLSELWVYRLGLRGTTIRRFTDLPSGETVIAARQHYFYSDIKGPGTYLLDGPRNMGTTGHAIKAIPHPEGRGFYVLSVNGRFWFQHRDGYVETFAGWRVHPGTNVPDWTASNSTRPEEVEWYRSRHQNTGQWDVPGRSWFRPWGFAARPSPPPHERGLHEFWVFNTFRHTIDYVDHRTAHGEDHHEGPGPGQQTTVRIAFGVDGVPQPPCLDFPWDGAFGPDGWLYFTVRGDTSGFAAICRVNADTGHIEPVVISSRRQFGEAAMRGYGNAASVREEQLVDGPFGTASLTMPNAMDFDSHGRLYFAEQFAGVIRRVDLVAGTISTIAAVPKYPFGREITMQIDRQGVVGPRDDLLGGAWGAQSDFRISADGDRITRAFPLRNRSPAMSGVSVNVASYPWMFAPGNAALPCIFATGNGSHLSALICRRLPGQPDLDAARYRRGRQAWSTAHPPYPALALTHGVAGQSQLGLPGWSEMAHWPDADIAAYAMSHGLSERDASDLVYAIRWETQHDWVEHGP